MKKSDANVIDRSLLAWIKAKHAEIDQQLGIALVKEGYHIDMVKDGDIELLFNSVDSKKGDTKIIRYYVKDKEKEIKLMEVQISLSSITVVKRK